MSTKPNLPITPRFPELGKARMVNGYIAYYTAEVQTLYEHRIVAERKLGRKLQTGEVVHHKNHIRHDNSDDNIEVLLVDQHSRQHTLERADENGWDVHKEYECLGCAKEYIGSKIRKYCSNGCASLARRKIIDRPSKEKLECMSQTMSNVKIAKLLGVSETAIRKWKKQYAKQQ